MVINRTQISTREMKALTIVGQNDQIKRINAVTYKVKSQNSDFWYDVKHPYKSDGNWTCTCPDHEFRKVECKHIKSVLISKELRKIVPNSEVNEIETEQEIICKCGSLDVIKTGIRHNKSGDIQRFKCKSCNAKWSDNLGFAKNKVSSKIITASLDLYFKGVALRKIKEHVKFFYGVNVSHVGILGWIRKFEKVVTPFVDSLVPKEMSGVYHIDEMAVHVRKEQTDKGHYQWLWNMMDNTTRFWISSKVSQKREVSDARAVFQDAKSKTPKPIAIIHDGLHSYNEAFEKEYHTMASPRTRNIRSVSVRHKGLNQKVERLNGVFRDREKVMRGMDHKESAQKTIDAFRIHYNFVREHSSIKKTPAEQAGIKLDLGQNKIENLIKMASKKS
jgi:transposase-like protein